MGSGKADVFLGDLSKRARESFVEHRRLLSFTQFVELVMEHPMRFARSSAQYVRDCFDHFGVEEFETVLGRRKHYKLFDCPFDGGRDRLIGQEEAQASVYQILTSFVQDGRIRRLVLLHGPNGSAKSSLIGCVQRALEAYSHTDEGALYRFNWIFPADKIARESIGFGGSGRTSPSTSSRDTYAFLDDLDVDAKLIDELKDNPLFLIEPGARRRLLEQSLPAGADFKLSDYILRGDLSHKSKRIYEALLTAYQGDLKAVTRHVQVERFFVSRRYRIGAVTVEPQFRVDAGARQVTADRSLQSLPASLQNQTLHELVGDLIDGNRGVVEYNDLLKRPQEYNRYLLATSEKATVSLDHANVHLDAVLLGSANETYLSAFKGSPEYPSFNARLELVRMPYLRDFRVEQRIYEEQISATEMGKPMAPHSTYVAALWAVLTRLKRPEPERHPEGVRGLIEHLSPLEKADLYADGAVPEGLSPDQARGLRAAVPVMMDLGADGDVYEGRYGASPREMKGLLLRAAQLSTYPHLSPLAIFDELRRLVRETSVYQFLQIKPDGEYYHHEHFIDVVTERYLDLLDKDVRSAMGLIDEARYGEYFQRYIDHVTHWLRKEKLYNRATGRSEEPDEGLMKEVEAAIAGGSSAEAFRNDIMGSIAAWSIDHPGQPMSYPAIFPRHFEALRAAYYEERREQIWRIKQNLLSHLGESSSSMSTEEAQQVRVTLDALQSKHGYTAESAREAIVFLIKHRYEG